MRQGFSVLWEAMIAELRAVQLDLHARATFAAEGETVQESRGVVAELTRPAPTEDELAMQSAQSGAHLSAIEREGWLEVG
jgi:hypothetical protein